MCRSTQSPIHQLQALQLHPQHLGLESGGCGRELAGQQALPRARAQWLLSLLPPSAALKNTEGADRTGRLTKGSGGGGVQKGTHSSLRGELCALRLELEATFPLALDHPNSFDRYLFSSCRIGFPLAVLLPFLTRLHPKQACIITSHALSCLGWRWEWKVTCTQGHVGDETFSVCCTAVGSEGRLPGGS